MKHRPFVVTILAGLSAIAGVVALYRCLQALGLFPFDVGPFSVNSTNLWSALMWGLMVWVYIWLTQMLWNMEPQGWMFLVIISIFELIMDFMTLISSRASYIPYGMIVTAFILIYCLLPGTKDAFGVPRK